jgi:hypothetical protein
MGFDPTIDFWWYWRREAHLAFQHRFFSFQDKPFADSVHGVHMHAKSLGNLATC